MENVNLKINGLSVTAPAGSTILEAAQAAGIRIPTLCYLKEINEIGACRMCVVEVKGQEIWWQRASIRFPKAWRYRQIQRNCLTPEEGHWNFFCLTMKCSFLRAHRTL